MSFVLHRNPSDLLKTLRNLLIIERIYKYSMNRTLAETNTTLSLDRSTTCVLIKMQTRQENSLFSNYALTRTLE